VEPIDRIFSDMIAESGMDSRKLFEARLEQEWTEIVGDNLAQHVSIYSLHGDHLTVQASDPSWSHQASMLRHQIQDRINDHFGEDLISGVDVKN